MSSVFKLCPTHFFSGAKKILGGFAHKCTGVHIFGDAKNGCPNLTLLSQITCKQHVLMLRLKRTSVN